jgi:hypothetical protein
MKAEFIIFCIGCVALGHAIAHLVRRHRVKPVSKADETFSGLGYSVEMDCRNCGKVNRVPAHRLRDQPKCGRCKNRLMPRSKIVVCSVTPMDGALRLELQEVWSDVDKLWQCLADHVILEAKREAEAKNPRRRAVN